MQRLTIFVTYNSMFLGISKDKLSVINSDFKPEGEKSTRLNGGFYYGVDRIWIPPRPLLNHGIHRCERLLVLIPLVTGTKQKQLITKLWQISSTSSL